LRTAIAHGLSSGVVVNESSIYDLIDRYEVMLFDAYDVLIDAQGACPGAEALICELNFRAKPYFVLTNDASRLPESWADVFQGLGLSIPAERIITSGQLLKDYFSTHGLVETRCAVLGTKDSLRYVELAGGRISSCKGPFDVLVIADQAGFPFFETIDAVLSALFRKLDLGETVQMILPNPDLVYPKSKGERSGFSPSCRRSQLDESRLHPQSAAPNFFPAIFGAVRFLTSRKDSVLFKFFANMVVE
jgi:ribonucleotide monophosphatase NagD (HAD superfamily)